MKIDYQKLQSELIRRCPGLLQEWFPKGHVKGSRFIIGNTAGDPGQSLSVELKTGTWKDFATDEGGDLVELYAKYFGIKNGEAAERLIKQYSFRDVVEDQVLMPVPGGLHREAPVAAASVQ